MVIRSGVLPPARQRRLTKGLRTSIRPRVAATSQALASQRGALSGVPRL